MPLYEYQCDGTCGRRFEVIRKFSDPPLEKCPTGGGPGHKLQPSPAFQFKGSGFYITDYPKKDQGKSEKSESSGSDSKETKPSTEKSEKSDTGSSTTEKKSSSDKAEKPAEKPAI